MAPDDVERVLGEDVDLDVALVVGLDAVSEAIGAGSTTIADALGTDVVVEAGITAMDGLPAGTADCTALGTDGGLLAEGGTSRLVKTTAITARTSAAKVATTSNSFERFFGGGAVCATPPTVVA